MPIRGASHYAQRLAQDAQGTIDAHNSPRFAPGSTTGVSVPLSGMDAFTNQAARMGVGTSSLENAAGYTMSRMSWDYMLLTGLYRDHWLIRKVVDGFPEDTWKNGFRLTGPTLTPQQLDPFYQTWYETFVGEKILEVDTWAQLYGGAIGVMLFEGHENYLQTPLDFDDIMPGSFCGLLVIDRWGGISPSSTLVSDIRQPHALGLPEFYECNLAGTPGTGSVANNAFRVHHSRVVRFTGPGVPKWERQAEQQWGISKVETMFAELKKRDNVSYSLANLFFRAQILALQFPDLASQLTTMNKDVQGNALRALEGLNSLLSNQGLAILPKDAQMQSFQYSFAGCAEVYGQFMLDICGATDYSMSRLFGRTASGLGSTGEGDQEIYEQKCTQRQNRYARPQLMHLLRAMAVSVLGEVPKGFGFKFNPIREASGKERAELAKAKSDALTTVYNAGGMTQKAYMQELRNLEEETGMFGSITDEDIAAASSDVTPPGEMMLGSGGLDDDDKEGAAGKP